jgi:hypothetical protein
MPVRGAGIGPVAGAVAAGIGVATVTAPIIKEMNEGVERNIGGKGLRGVLADVQKLNPTDTFGHFDTLTKVLGQGSGYLISKITGDQAGADLYKNAVAEEFRSYSDAFASLKDRIGYIFEGEGSEKLERAGESFEVAVRDFQAAVRVLGDKMGATEGSGTRSPTSMNERGQG